MEEDILHTICMNIASDCEELNIPVLAEVQTTHKLKLQELVGCKHMADITFLVEGEQISLLHHPW